MGAEAAVELLSGLPIAADPGDATRPAGPGGLACADPPGAEADAAPALGSDELDGTVAPNVPPPEVGEPVVAGRPPVAPAPAELATPVPAGGDPAVGEPVALVEATPVVPGVWDVCERGRIVPPGCHWELAAVLPAVVPCPYALEHNAIEMTAIRQTPQPTRFPARIAPASLRCWLAARRFGPSIRTRECGIIPHNQKSRQER